MVEISRFKKILTPVDGSKESLRAVDVAISIARKYDSWLTALYIVHIPFGENRSSYPRTMWYKEFADDVKEDTRKWFEEIQKKGKENKLEIEMKMTETIKSVPSEIVRFAEVDKTDLIVIGSRGRSGVKKLLLGSVASGVLTYAPCPVMVVR
ncbi:universal stress protein UspA-like protein [Candidatus Nitrososphaera evergladensis SR1]|uniref:Universal stress protein UspA-like protein n=1 Tax=Candidatus Nitrososphaera evergladensis SR1 TaxID=1459636 RepID=A0A075MP45_9ARCH|nr:universal stress protein [Candidatus Nitrososphaera evergladensis]AIF82983.1 universal stress protein UspA-like protein [Candidatus Nitrososphaera evergladensis SR1]